MPKINRMPLKRL